MEQKDYFLREIERIGKILSVFRQKLFGGKEDFSISMEKQFENLKTELLAETDFDLDHLLTLNVEESNEYVSRFSGFTLDNIELLAGCFFQAGLNDESIASYKYLEKAKQLYEYCNLKSKTYSSDREMNLNEIKKYLEL